MLQKQKHLKSNLSNDKKSTQLPQAFSGLKPNIHLLHLSVLRQLSNQRSGTASTKTKSEVRGGGAKPWKQKGTGRARAGSSRSPLWVGGGITFGPKPRSFKFDLPKKAKKLAIAQAITLRSDDITVLKNLPEVTDSKTKNLLKELKHLGIIDSCSLVVGNSTEPNFNEVNRASHNLPNVCLKDAHCVGVYDILRAEKLVFTESALSLLEKKFLNLSMHRKNKKVGVS